MSSPVTPQKSDQIKTGSPLPEVPGPGMILGNVKLPLYQIVLYESFSSFLQTVKFPYYWCYIYGLEYPPLANYAVGTSRGPKLQCVKIHHLRILNVLTLNVPTTSLCGNPVTDIYFADVETLLQIWYYHKAYTVPSLILFSKCNRPVTFRWLFFSLKSNLHLILLDWTSGVHFAYAKNWHPEVSSPEETPVSWKPRMEPWRHSWCPSIPKRVCTRRMQQIKLTS